MSPGERTGVLLSLAPTLGGVAIRCMSNRLIEIRYDAHVSALAQQLLAHLRARTEAMAALLLDLARMESPSLDAASQEPVFARLSSELAAVGFRVRRLPGRQTGGQLWAVPRERRQ